MGAQSLRFRSPTLEEEEEVKGDDDSPRKARFSSAGGRFDDARANGTRRRRIEEKMTFMVCFIT